MFQKGKMRLGSQSTLPECNLFRFSLKSCFYSHYTKQESEGKIRDLENPTLTETGLKASGNRQLKLGSSGKYLAELIGDKPTRRPQKINTSDAEYIPTLSVAMGTESPWREEPWKLMANAVYLSVIELIVLTQS